MVSIVPSRFAGLKIEDDDDDEEQPGFQRRGNKKQQRTSQQQQQQPVNNKDQAKSNNKNKLHQQPQNKKVVNQSKKKKKSNSANEEQWSQWQQRDQEFVDIVYEKDLEAALIQSKLDFEAKKTDPDKIKNGQEKKQNKQGKPKKSQPMGLQEFTQMMESKSNKAQAVKEESEAEKTKTSNFFESINEQAKNIRLKEEMQNIGQTQKIKNPKESTSKNKLVPTIDLTSIDSNKEIEMLQDENSKIRGELEAVKEKCKKMQQILKNAEVKEKVELLLEIQNLKKFQNEMSEEISSLYQQLEQEKSRSSHVNSNSNSASDGKSRSALRKSVRFDEREVIHTDN